MSSSSSSSSSTSYSYGIPGSQVTLNITKDGNRSLTLLRGSNSKTSSGVPVPAGQRKFPDGRVGPANMPFCKVCYDAGLSVAGYTNHFVKDQPGPGGKVVCPTLLAQKCLVCGVAGHTSSYCPLKRLHESQDVEKAHQEREKAKKENGGWETVGAKGQVTTAVKSKPRIEDIDLKKPAPAPAPALAAPVVKYGGSFGVLAVDDSSDSEEEYKDVPKPVRKEAVPPPSTAEASKPLTWAQRAAAAAQKPVPVSSSSSSSSTASFIDSRFQFHALCENIQESKRASAASKKATHVPPPTEATQQQPVNARAAAAAVASESSKKRKQNAAMVPA
jgi:hypothetical protein